MSAFVGDLLLKLVDDVVDAQWELLVPFTYQSDVAKQTFTAPQGFVTNFCSVPHIPFAAEFFCDRARRAGVIHDWLYEGQVPGITREMADEVLREMCLLCGLPHWTAESFYLGVRAGGAAHWKGA